MKESSIEATNVRKFPYFLWKKKKEKSQLQGKLGYILRKQNLYNYSKGERKK